MVNIMLDANNIALYAATCELHKKEKEMIRFRLKELISDEEFKSGKRITLGNIALATGIKQPTLSRISGTRGYNTTTDNIDKLCRYFGCQVADLMEYVPDKDVTG